MALKSKSFQFSDRRLKFVSSNPIPKKHTRMSEEVKTDAAPAEAPSAEDLKGQKRTLEVKHKHFCIFAHIVFPNKSLSYCWRSFIKIIAYNQILKPM